MRWTMTIPPSYDICIHWLMLKNRVYVYALNQNYKNQLEVICASLFARQQLAREQHRPFLSCIVTSNEKWCLHVNIGKIKEWLSPNKRRICGKCSNISTWHSICPRLYSLSSNDKTSVCKLKHNNYWTSNKKWQSINKPIATGIPRHKTKSLRNYAST